MQDLFDWLPPAVVPVVLTLAGTLVLLVVVRIATRRFAEDSVISGIANRLTLGFAVVANLIAMLGLVGFDVPVLLNHLGNFQLTTFGDVQVTPVTVVVFVTLLGIAWYGSIFAREGTIRALTSRKLGDSGTIASVSRLVQYATGFLGVAVALDFIGIDLTTLVTAGAVFAVGIGFALQNIAQNFVSGVILLAERSISPGDIVEIDGRMVRIRVLGIRSTIASTLDDEELIIPNSFLVQSNVKNLTLNDDSLRIRLVVGVAYESDLDVVLRALQQAAEAMPARMPSKEPVVALIAFGSSSVDFEVSIWTSDPWSKLKIRSDLAFVIWRALKEAGVTIAFPQLDVHFDGPFPTGPLAPQGNQEPTEPTA
jgi:small-conductance mechanosensitive channel